MNMPAADRTLVEVRGVYTASVEAENAWAMPADSTSTSKFLSYVLRHNPAEVGLQLDSSGWVSVEDLLRACRHANRPLSREQLEAIVRSSDKQRFAFSDDGAMIRANQGHSLPVELGLESKVPPTVLYHGTAERFIESIRASGLRKGQRQHVHLTESKETAGTVGRRYGKLHLLVVDAERMAGEGIAFYQADNGVWLTDSVPVQYIDFDAGS